MLFTKNIKTANRIIAILLMVTAISAFVYMKVAGVFNGPGIHFVDAMPPKDAYSNIDDYRDSWTLRKKTNVVWYKASDIKNYIDNIYPDLKSTLPAAPTGYEWGVGFYTMRRPYPDVDSKSMLDFLVVPTLYNSTTNDLLDFRNTQHSMYYTRSGATSRTQYQDRIGYDAGHLYP